MMNGVPQSVIQVSSSSQHSTAQHCDDEIRIHRKDSLHSVNGEQRATSLDNKSHYLALAYLE